MFFVVSTHGLIVLSGSVSHHTCDLCLGGGQASSRLMHRGYFWKGVGLRRRGESDGEEEEGDSDSQLQHLREDGENDFCCRLSCAMGWVPVGNSHRCVISQGLRVHPHHTVYNEEAPHRPQDCSEWVRPVNGETYPVRKANGCRPKKRGHIVLSPWQQPFNKNRTEHICIKKYPPTISANKKHDGEIVSV